MCGFQEKFNFPQWDVARIAQKAFHSAWHEVWSGDSSMHSGAHPLSGAEKRPSSSRPSSSRGGGGGGSLLNQTVFGSLLLTVVFAFTWYVRALGLVKGRTAPLGLARQAGLVLVSCAVFGLVLGNVVLALRR
jgi:hypothetical protein